MDEEQKKHMDNNRKVDRADLKAVVVIVMAYLLIEAVGITCPIKFMTGISCAGCGMSRAWIAAIHLDFARAFYYHPLFWIIIPAGIWILAGHKMPQKVYQTGICLICILMLGVYIMRFFDHSQDIVVFDPMNGFFMRVIRYVLSLAASFAG